VLSPALSRCSDAGMGPAMRRTERVAATLMPGHGRGKRVRAQRNACEVVHSAAASREGAYLQKEGGILW
jgi:hypothetical protein